MSITAIELFFADLSQTAEKLSIPEGGGVILLRMSKITVFDGCMAVLSGVNYLFGIVPGISQISVAKNAPKRRMWLG